MCPRFPEYINAAQQFEKRERRAQKKKDAPLFSFATHTCDRSENGLGSASSGGGLGCKIHRKKGKKKLGTKQLGRARVGDTHGGGKKETFFILFVF